MNTIKLLKIATWVFMILAIIFFWLSLRMQEDNLEYTIYALLMILVAWGTNYLIKKQNG
jgi:hypothetical protein